MDPNRLTARYREREAKQRLLARYRAAEPQWQLDETARASLATVKTAAFPPFDKEAEGGGDMFPPKDEPLDGKKKRNIPKDHPFDPKSLKPLSKALWASSVAMGHALTAYRHLSRLKSATISPDGMLGGRGYVMDISEIRKRLNDACESLSAITDTIHDEISAPHWKPRLSELDENEQGDVQNYLDKSEAILENPEEDAENEADAIEKQNDHDEVDGVDEEGESTEEGFEEPQQEGAPGLLDDEDGAEGEEEGVPAEEPEEGDEEEDGGLFQEDSEEGEEPAEEDAEAVDEPEEGEDDEAGDETLDEQEGDEGWETEDEEGGDEDEGGDLLSEGDESESEEGDEEAEEPGDEEAEPDDEAEPGDEDEDAEEGDDEESEDEDEESDDEEADPELQIDDDDLETAEQAAEGTDHLWEAKPSKVKPGGDFPGEPETKEEPAEEEELPDAAAAPGEDEEEPVPPNPKIKKKKKKPGKPPLASELPTGGGNPSAGLAEKPQDPMIRQARRRVANSSLPVETLPGGPRVEHLDREDGPPENGPSVLDDWGTPSERDYLYPTPWENDLHEASAAVPDGSFDDTPTEAWDFGLGYGAKGQGAGGYANPSGEGNGKGVWGPSSGLPGSPPQSSGDTTPKIDVDQNEKKSRDTLPGDNDFPAARSDYYRGDRGNLVNTQSVIPGEPTPSGDNAPSMMNTDEVHEDVSTPYVRYDYTTHEYRDDPLHSWPQHHAGTRNG